MLAHPDGDVGEVDLRRCGLDGRLGCGGGGLLACGGSGRGRLDTDFIRIVEARRDDGDAHGVAERVVDGRAEDDVGVDVRRLLDGHRCLADLVHREVLGRARDIEQDAARAVDARLEQRGVGGCLGGVDGGVLTGGLADAHECGAGVAHDGLDVREVEVNHARHRDEIRDALDALAQDIIGDAERLHDGGALVDDLEQAVVRDRDDGIDVLLERRDAGLGAFAAQRALERERLRDDADGERADLPCALRDDGRRARARAAAHAGRDEYHVGAAQGLDDVVAALLGGLLADLRARAGAEAARELFTDLHALRRHRMEEGLGIRIDGDELHALHAKGDHAVDGVAAAAAHTDDFDFCELIEYVII